MITVDDALAHIFDLVSPLGAETVSLIDAAGRVLARPIAAKRDQPPFAGSAMDGYALQGVEATQGATFTVIGESAAGHRFAGAVNPGEAVRIFTGAAMPKGADRVILQEDVTRTGERITLGSDLSDGPHVRPAGADFRTGDQIGSPRILTPSDVALLAAMNIAEVPVMRRPDVALIATGDELVMPGEIPGPDQIIASNSFGLHALLAAIGAVPRLLPIARDSVPSLETAFDMAAGADLIVTIGGASVGDHDLVGPVAESLGMQRAFYKVAMRPGKPLMAGRLNDTAMIGLPGNPVSAMVCGHVFLRPAIRAMLGLGTAPAPRRIAALAEALPANGPREHYMRARLSDQGIRVTNRQDSALLSVLADADALLVRPANDPARQIGDSQSYIKL